MKRKEEYLQKLNELAETEDLHGLSPCNTRTLNTAVILENLAPTLKWANIATVNTAFGLRLDEDVCEVIRFRVNLKKDKFWHLPWVIDDGKSSSRCDNSESRRLSQKIFLH